MSKYEVFKLFIKRFVSLLTAFLMVAAALCLPAFAADEDPENEQASETKPAPTQAPTDPPLTAENYGYAAYAELLDKTVYTEEMGALYSKASTTFKVWSPVASSVKVCIYKTGSDEEPGAQMISSNKMKYSPKVGAWYLTLKGDYKNLYYTYQVTVDGQTHEVVDPYAKAAGVNGDRGMIVDLDETDPDGWDEDTFARVAFNTDAVVWEVNVRDFSDAPSSGVSEENRGKYLAFTETGTTLNGEGNIATCVDYLKELGVNYVQIGPFYDFASVDESADLGTQYNWGYDPKNYNVPEGSYASDPYDGRVRIKECKEMIAALHKAGIGVIMDVVYNHTYESENSFFNQIVPDYYYRISEDGTWSNGSGCGNDIASERTMVREFIKNSVVYWAEEYHIDGFRFDLMGLTDTSTMAYIRRSLDALPDGKKILMYGEAWSMNTAAKSGTTLANQSNLYLLSQRIGAFNDTARDAVKGSNFNAKEQGFVQSGSSKGGVREGIEGQSQGGWAQVPNQCVNYVSCHDNLTLYDKLTASVYGDENYYARRNDLVEMNKLAAAVVLTSRGMPFMLAGEEMGRSKGGDENSYRSSAEINRIDWENLEKYPTLVNYYRGLIDIRRTVGLFRTATGEDVKLSYLDGTDKETIAFTLTSDESSAVVVYNGNPSKKSTVTLPSGNWVILADADRAGTESLGVVSGSVTAKASSCVILLDLDSFESIGGQKETTCQVAAQFVDADTGEVVFEKCYEGEKGEEYTIEIPKKISFNYNLVSGSLRTSGTFDNIYDVTTIEVRAYDGEFSSVTVRFVDEEDRELSNALVMTNRVGQQYYTTAVPGVDGYTLDLANLPENAAGVYTEEPVEVVFRYVPYVEDEDSGINPALYCRANVIYMSDTGEVFETKSYRGSFDETLLINYLEYDGYEFTFITDEEARFSDLETNVILYYHSTKTSYLLPVLISCGAAALVLLIIFLSAGSGKSRKRNAILIDE